MEFPVRLPVSYFITITSCSLFNANYSRINKKILTQRIKIVIKLIIGFSLLSYLFIKLDIELTTELLLKINPWIFYYLSPLRCREIFLEVFVGRFY